MPCSFGLLPHPRSEPGVQPIELLEVTVVDRCIPPVTAAYGTSVARPVRMTTPHLAATAPSLASGVRSALGDHRLVGKSPEGSRQFGHQALNLCRSFSLRGRRSSVARVIRRFVVFVSRLLLPCLASFRTVP
jgi:hypothetical protein